MCLCRYRQNECGLQASKASFFMCEVTGARQSLGHLYVPSNGLKVPCHMQSPCMKTEGNVIIQASDDHIDVSGDQRDPFSYQRFSGFLMVLCFREKKKKKK